MAIIRVQLPQATLERLIESCRLIETALSVGMPAAHEELRQLLRQLSSGVVDAEKYVRVHTHRRLPRQIRKYIPKAHKRKRR